MKPVIVHWILAGAALAVAPPAFATDFTLDVPVHVSDMPRLTTGYVECVVSTERLGGDIFAAGNVIGRHSTFFNFVNGAYDGTITVPIDNTSSRASTDAKSYTCQLFGNVLNDSGNEIAIPARVWRFNYPEVTHIPVDRETTFIQANLP